jgi:hypothetical protein
MYRYLMLDCITELHYKAIEWQARTETVPRFEPSLNQDFFSSEDQSQDDDLARPAARFN